MAQIYYQARLAGEPILLGPKQVAEVAAKIAEYGQVKAPAAETE
jgi:hypothetical protein